MNNDEEEIEMIRNNSYMSNNTDTSVVIQKADNTLTSSGIGIKRQETTVKHMGSFHGSLN